MLVSLSGRAHACALALVFGWTSLFSAAAHGADATAKDSAATRGEAPEVELFAGIDAGKVEATVIPRDSKKVTLQLRNKTAGPLAIRLPEAFAAMPVLAQFPGGGGLFAGAGFAGGNRGAGIPGGQNGGGQNGGTQGLGVSGGGQNGGFQGAGNGRNLGGPGIFNVPAGKVVKVKLASVCLEYGKPEPSAKNAYEIKPLASLCDKPEVVSILRSLGDGEVSQEVAQLAAWNVASGTSFQQISALQSKLGQQLPIYSDSAVAAAQELVRLVSEGAKGDKEQTVSRSTSPGRSP